MQSYFRYSALAPYGVYEVSEDIHQGLVLVVGEFTRVEVHAVFCTSLVLNVSLYRIIQEFHLLPAAGAIDVANLVVFFADVRITAVDIV